MKIFSGTSNQLLAQKVAKKLETGLSPLEIHIFPDTEKRVRVLEKVVDEDCVVVQPTSPNPDVNYMELFFIVDALRRSGAKTIKAVIPYLGYQRQDHVFRDGEAVSLDVIATLLKWGGVDEVISFDLHSIKIPEIFKIKFTHLSALSLFAEKIRKMFSGARGPAPTFPSVSAPSTSSQVRAVGIPSSHVTPRNYTLDAKRYPLTLVSPDMGGIRRIKILSEMLDNMPYLTIEKNRDLADGKIKMSKINRQVKKNVIIVDDMISTGNTIVAASELLRKNGAENIYVFATHAVFSKDAPIILSAPSIKKVFVTDTIDIPESKRFQKLEILSIADLIAKQLKI